MARRLIAQGFDAAALAGGYKAWIATQPVEPKQTELGITQQPRMETTGIELH